MDDRPAPTDIPAPATYHWTPALQREFLEQLAATGSVRTASAMICMSTRAAYDLRQRAEGAAFRVGWAAAVLLARGRLADELLDRAIWGFEEHYERDTVEAHRQFVKRRRHDARLGLAMLARLDRIAAERMLAGEDLLAQCAAGHWAAFLDLVARDTVGEARTAALAIWLAERGASDGTALGGLRAHRIQCEVDRISGLFGEAVPAVEAADDAPEAAAAEMSVWFDDRAEDWRTDFPPPDDFTGDEEGQFGDPGYQRELSEDERLMADERHEADTAPLRAAGEAARRAFFNLPDPANDRDAQDCHRGRGPVALCP